MNNFFLALCLLAAPISVGAQTLVFHLAGGAKSSVTLPATFTVTPTGDKLVIEGGGTRVELSDDDVTCVTYRAKSGDVNGDQMVDVADIASLLRIMAGYKPGEDDNPITPGQAPENAKAIDLGLPSGTKWANMNVGATSPQENGLYFAWGETKGYTASTSDGRSFDWASYKWMTPGHISVYYVNKYQVVTQSSSLPQAGALTVSSATCRMAAAIGRHRSAQRTRATRSVSTSFLALGERASAASSGSQFAPCSENSASFPNRPKTNANREA